MRNIFRGILFVALLFAGGLSAQTLKFGHIEFQQVFQAMPEKDAAQKAVDKVQTELENQLAAMQKELSDKGKEYVAQQKTLSDAVRASKEDEINSIQQRIQNFSQTAQENLQKEQAKQFQPVLDKAKKAIADVAKEQGLIYVFEVNGLLYHSDQSIDLLPLVKKKLGLK